MDGGTAPRKLFGTDGVRGVAGEFLSAELATALGRAAAAISPAEAPAGADRQGHARVGRDARGRARRRRGGGRRPRPAGRRPAHARAPRCWCAATGSTWPRSCPPRTTPTRTTGSSSSGPRAPSSTTRRRPRSSACSASPPARGWAACASSTAPRPTTCASSRRASRTCASTASACCSTAPTAPPTGSRPRSSAASAPTSTRSPSSPTAATSTATAAPPTSSRSRSTCDGHDLGFAFDGDGDRVLAVDRNGVVVDGDELIALAALHLREHDRLPGNGVAVTVMTNYGFHQSMSEHGVEVATTAGRRPQRAARAAPARLGARRRAVRPHHRHRLRARRRRHRRGPADARGARRRRPRGASRDGEAAPATAQRAGCPIATRWTAPTRSGRPSTRPACVSKGGAGY